MVLTFPWGTVKDTPLGVAFSLAHGLYFDMTRQAAGILETYIGGQIVSGCKPTAVIMGVGDLRMEWDPPKLPATAKSVLKIGYDGKSLHYGFDPKRATTILNHVEAQELSYAIIRILKAAKRKATKRTAPVVQSIP